jgi:hypothetical protein
MSEQNGNGHAEVDDKDAWKKNLKRFRDRTDHVGDPALNEAGEWVCIACQRPTTRLGLALTDQGPDGEKRRQCKVCYGGMLNFPDMKDPDTRALMKEHQTAVKGYQKKPRLTDILRERAEKAADLILDPYFEILEMEPNPEWSERTKLDFKQGQVSVSEKLLNRLEGLPTQRIRNVDADDNDVRPQFAGLPAPAQERALMGLLTGAPHLLERVRADLELADDDVTEVPNEEDQP